MTKHAPVRCPACGLLLHVVPLSEHQKNCPVVRFPMSAAATESIFAALVRAAHERQNGVK